MLCKVTHCTGRVSANTRPHQLRWGDGEMGTAISCTEVRWLALFKSLSCVAIVIIDRHVLSVRKCMCACAHTEALEVPEVLMASKAQCKQCEANSVCLKGVCV